MSKNRKHIPEHTKNELIELFGNHSAQKMLESNMTFKELSNIILEEKIARKFKLKKLQKFLKEKLRIDLISAFLVLVVIIFIVFQII